MSDQTDSLARIPVTALRGVGPKGAERLAKLGVHSVQDVLFHLPFRYQDRTKIVPVGSLRPGDQAVIDVTVDHADIRFGKRRSLLVQVSDGTGAMILRFFHFTAAQKSALARGVRLRCFGEVRNGPQHYELVHPEYHHVADDESIHVEQALTPIYPTTEGFHQLSWRDLIAQALQRLGKEGALDELLPSGLLSSFDLPTLSDAIRLLHRPPPELAKALVSEEGHPAQHRLAFEELLAHQLSMRLMRDAHRQQTAPVFDPTIFKLPNVQKLLGALAFDLTGAQRRVIDEIAKDTQQPYPMLRLVQGDVGSGKTIVAAIAALQAIEAGYQVALMAPTEILAEQHRVNFENWFSSLGIQVGWLSGRLKGKKREAMMQQVSQGDLPMIVGTHALFQESVEFANLGLVIVDEQHRFGVHQRLALRSKGKSVTPHQLIMTATPIPRTLAMTAYADLDLSVIDELPPGRKPIKTVLVSEQRQGEVIERVRLACESGRQAYWVCTLIEESELLQAQAAEQTSEMLTKALAPLKVGLVHGRMKAPEKADVMQQFKSGELHLLVATTVIEVGVDVPNASLMVMANAERLGLSQLHQLRGRVGRGAQDSYCVLLYHPPLGAVARERLEIMRQTNDGFVIAQKDLEIRGPGEVLGTRQTGEVQFRLADLIRDQHWVEPVQKAADQLIAKKSEHIQPLIQRWIGEKQNYSAV
ncbi:MAG: ATP-dependent DNA helicase RecG [Sedimenticolaceae bacterium]